MVALQAIGTDPADDALPFAQTLLRCRAKVGPPSYLREGGAEADRYVMTPLFPRLHAATGRTGWPLLQPWPDLSAASTLDESQTAALRQALTAEVALVQGPPGTGKTYLGLLAVRALLANGERRRACPILVVCATNHALDQFLEGILEFEERLVRVGSRSKSEALEALNLRALVRTEWEHDEQRRRLRSALHRRIKELAAQLDALAEAFDAPLPLPADVCNEGEEEEEAARAAAARRAEGEGGGGGNGAQVLWEQPNAASADEGRRLATADEFGPSEAGGCNGHACLADEQLLALRCVPPAALAAAAAAEGVGWGGGREREGGYLSAADALALWLLPVLRLRHERASAAERQAQLAGAFGSFGGAVGGGAADVAGRAAAAGGFGGGDADAEDAEEEEAQLSADPASERLLDSEGALFAEATATADRVGGGRAGVHRGAMPGSWPAATAAMAAAAAAADKSLHAGSSAAGAWRAGPPPIPACGGEIGAVAAAGGLGGLDAGGRQEGRALLRSCGLAHSAELWAMAAEEREALAQLWVERRRRALLPSLREACGRYERLCAERSELDSDVQLAVLRRQRVIGMTTTAVSKYAHMLRIIGSEVLIVEEAAEVGCGRHRSRRAPLLRSGWLLRCPFSRLVATAASSRVRALTAAPSLHAPFSLRPPSHLPRSSRRTSSLRSRHARATSC